MDLLIQFLAGGEMLVDVDSPFIDMKVAPGRWSVGPAEGTSGRHTNKNAGGLCTVLCCNALYLRGVVPGITTGVLLEYLVL